MAAKGQSVKSDEALKAKMQRTVVAAREFCEAVGDAMAAFPALADDEWLQLARSGARTAAERGERCLGDWEACRARMSLPPVHERIRDRREAVESGRRCLETARKLRQIGKTKKKARKP